MEKTKEKNLKERFLYYKKQKKFKLSVLDWAPHVDWYALLLFLFVAILSANIFAYQTYHKIMGEIDANPVEIKIEKEIIDYDSVAQLINAFQSREEVLNNLR